MTDTSAATPGPSAGGVDGTLMARMGLEVTACTADGAEGWLPVAGNTQPYGVLHGGASAVLVETLASVAAATHAGPGRIALGVDLNVTHHRAVRTGRVHGVATALALGRSVASYEVTVRDEQDRTVATGRLTCHLREAPRSG
ncbi:PaaI family thioesterase [Ornithinicoccus halotolerans]|uniref:PaaI family thioesterase n=1 Tax=Ornithinicoccus halotolerans TaxID=1748220 RepID=UPI001294C6E3|nr:hotdog fold thioesterase [Ornithinicoccus halotolerans]